jgi:hypothetical protein
LQRAGTAGVMKASENVWHVVAGQRAPAIAAALGLNLNASKKLRGTGVSPVNG